VDGERELFESPAIATRSHLPGRLYFQGWIAFNPAQLLSEIELYRIAVHEIGHILGLQHSSNAMSLMYGFDLEGSEWLDPTDPAATSAPPQHGTAAFERQSFSQGKKDLPPPGCIQSSEESSKCHA